LLVTDVLTPVIELLSPVCELLTPVIEFFISPELVLSLPAEESPLSSPPREELPTAMVRMRSTCRFM